MIYYDQDGLGVFSIFQTIALVKNGPNPANASRLIDYLLTQRTEKELISMNAVQFPMLTNDDPGRTPQTWTAQSDEMVDSLDSSVKLLRKYIE
jgi:ABC-type Fe3+ transport system substrate-binding protein